MIGFAEPAAFVFTALYGVLVVLYLWERWRRRVVVPSLLLWESVPEEVLRARRFRPDLLFLLQLLALTALIGGLAQPFRAVTATAAATRQVLVLDTTASMQARTHVGAASRLDMARDEALAHLHGLPADAEVMLIAAGQAPEIIVGFTRDHAAVETALRALTAADTGGDLGLSLAVAAAPRQRTDRATAIHVFTDRPREELPATLRDAVTVHHVGTAEANLAIGALQVFQGPFEDPRAAHASVQLHNFSPDEAHGVLTIRLDQQIIKRIGFTIDAHDARGFLIDGFPGPGRVVASIDAADGLAADNTAWGWIRPVAPVRGLVVSPPSPLVDDLRRLAQAMPGLQLTIVDPTRFDAAAADRAGIVIFNQWAPPAEPSANALYVYPPPDNPVFPVRGDAERVDVIDWNAAHPALQSIRPLAALPVRQTRIVATPAWSTALVWSRTAEGAFPLALAGERNGHRVACIAFDLATDRLLGTDNVSLLMFFVNLLGWLAPQPSDDLVATTGQVLALPDLPPGPALVRTPPGAELTLAADRRLLDLRTAGEYTVTVGNTAQRIVANFFDPAESDLSLAGSSAPDTGTSAGKPAPAIAVTPPSDPRGRVWLYVVAVGCLVIEWIVRRRGASEGQP